ncbi:MAG: Type II secretion system protein G precursor [Chloroflexi bacterium ADurb.Bin344]|nr:MAG: Type II secretion system protein G precursor [Chloroflexi bacterium ADurb.Bin344]
MKNKKNGFTLVELLVVMFIIAILTGVLLPNLMGARQKAKDAQRIGDADAMRSALRMYYKADYNAMVVALPTYMPAVPEWVDDTDPDIDFDYVSIDPYDTFTIRFKLESASGEEDTNSQLKCGVTPTNGVYAVCAN